MWISFPQEVVSEFHVHEHFFSHEHKISHWEHWRSIVIKESPTLSRFLDFETINSDMLNMLYACTCTLHGYSAWPIFASKIRNVIRARISCLAVHLHSKMWMYMYMYLITSSQDYQTLIDMGVWLTVVNSALCLIFDSPPCTFVSNVYAAFDYLKNDLWIS